MLSLLWSPGPAHAPSSLGSSTGCELQNLAPPAGPRARRPPAAQENKDWVEPAGRAWAAHAHAGAWEQHHSPSQELHLRNCPNTCQTPLGGPARGPSGLRRLRRALPLPAQGEAAAISSQALSPASRYDLQRLSGRPASMPGQPLPCLALQGPWDSPSQPVAPTGALSSAAQWGCPQLWLMTTVYGPYPTSGS